MLTMLAYTKQNTTESQQLCEVRDDAGAPYGSAYLPAERPVEACSLWRTFRVQVDPPIRASASVQVPVGNEGD